MILSPHPALMVGLACALVAVVGARPTGQGVGARPSGQGASGAYKGLEVAVASVARATNVSLTDCPAGANSVRGVIRPGDANEFVSVTLDFKVQPAFKPAPVPSPVLHDETGKTYNTAQTFGEVAATPSFSCTFSFRVPKGTKPARLAIDTASLDLSKGPQK